MQSTPKLTLWLLAICCALTLGLAATSFADETDGGMDPPRCPEEQTEPVTVSPLVDTLLRTVPLITRLTSL